jgi:hypothetical protein
MKRLRALLLVAAFALTGLTTAQALDFEIRYETGLLGSTPGIGGAARLNLPIGPELFGARLWILPEVGGIITGLPEGYARVQILADASGLTIFGDARYSFLPNGDTRGQFGVGVRFGIDLSRPE